METWAIQTDDGDGHFELHTFRPAPGAAAAPEQPEPVPAGGHAPARPAGDGVVVVPGTLITDAPYPAPSHGT